MTVSFVKSRRTTRNISLYCSNSCRAYLGFNKLNKFNSILNPNYLKISQASLSNNLGGKPTWSLKTSNQPLGLAHPPNYNPRMLINQYGRLNGTGGVSLRNF